MELKKGEKIIKQGEVKYIPLVTSLSQVSLGSFMQYWHHGTLYLTNQRLFIEYYDIGVPILNMSRGPTKRELEVPLTAIRKVGGFWNGFGVLCKIDGKPMSLQFRCPSIVYLPGFSDWVPQICKMANLQPTTLAEGLHDLLTVENTKALLVEFAIFAVLAVITIILLVWAIGVIFGVHP